MKHRKFSDLGWNVSEIGLGCWAIGSEWGDVSDDDARKTLQTSQDPEIPQKTECLDRSNLWLMETPQATRRDWLDDGLRKAEKQGLTVTDELSIIELNKRKVAFHNPDYPNPKITKESDLAYIQYLLEMTLSLL